MIKTFQTWEARPDGAIQNTKSTLKEISKLTQKR